MSVEVARIEPMVAEGAHRVVDPRATYLTDMSTANAICELYGIVKSVKADHLTDPVYLKTMFCHVNV